MGLPDELVIRRAQVTDAEALTALQTACWEEAYTGLMPQRVLDDRRASGPERTERWREILTDERHTLLAEGPGGLAGFVNAGQGRDSDIDTELELRALYVRARWWGTGLGYALFETALGDRAAYLWVLDGNARAIGFYERQGFRLDGTRDELDDGLHVRMVRAGT